MNKTYLFAIMGILATGLLTAGGTISSSSVVAQNMTDVGNETGSVDYANKTMKDKNMIMQDGGNMTTGSADNSTGVM